MIKNFTLLVSSLAILTSIQTASAGGEKWPIEIIRAGKKIIRMTPPALQERNKGMKVVRVVQTCNEGPNFDVIRGERTTTINNHGHGVGTVMLAPGSAAHVRDIVEKEVNRENPPIDIYGSGFNALCTAERLSRKYEVKIHPDPYEALRALTTVDLEYESVMSMPQYSNASPEMKELVEQLAWYGFLYYSSLAERDLLQPNSHFRCMPYYCENRIDSGFQPFVKKGHIWKAYDVTLDFNGTKRHALRYPNGLWLNRRAKMEDLTREFMEKGLFGNGSKPTAPIIINCISRWEANMNSEQQLFIMLQNQPNHDQFEEQHILFSRGTEGTTLSGLSATRSICRSPGSIGGTTIKHGTITEDNDDEFKRIWDEAQEYYGVSGHD